MGTSIIRAQGFVEMNLLDAGGTTGSVGFELGPDTAGDTERHTSKTVTTMTIGGRQRDRVHRCERSLLDPIRMATIPSIRVSLNPSSVGFHITDLDVGLVAMASVSLTDLGVYLGREGEASRASAWSASIHSRRTAASISAIQRGNRHGQWCRRRGLLCQLQRAAGSL